MKLPGILFLALLLSGCAHKKPVVVAAPVPAIKPLPPKPKFRPIRPGDYILQTPEVQSDGTVVCHRPILVIDSTKKREEVSVYKCR